MRGHFVQDGKSFPIAARPQTNEKSVQVLLPPGLAKKYDVDKKDLPLGIPTSWTDPNGKSYSISWINNFGLKPKGSSKFAPGKVDDDYEILLDKEAGKTLFYYDGVIKPFEPSDLGQPTDKPDKVAAKLRLGDPPIGWG